jgi:hypothetical protein
MPNDPYGGFTPNPTAPNTAPPVPTNQEGGPISQPAALPQLSNLAANQLLGYGCTCEWTTDYGLRSSPVAAGALAANEAFWRSHSGSQIMVLSAISVSITDAPILPHPDTGDANNVLIASRLVNIASVELPDGNYGLGALLVLIYQLQKPKVLGVDSFDWPANAKMTLGPGYAVLQPQNFYSYLSQASAIVGGNKITF